MKIMFNYKLKQLFLKIIKSKNLVKSFNFKKIQRTKGPDKFEERLWN